MNNLTTPAPLATDSAKVLLQHLSDLGIVLSVDGTRLRYKAPPSVLNAELRALIAAHRDELILRLSNEVTSKSLGTLASLGADNPTKLPNCEVEGRNVAENGQLNGRHISVGSAAEPADTQRFANWIPRFAADGCLGWEDPDLPESSRWWARSTFDALPSAGISPTDQLPHSCDDPSHRPQCRAQVTIFDEP